MLLQQAGAVLDCSQGAAQEAMQALLPDAAMQDVPVGVAAAATLAGEPSAIMPRHGHDHDARLRAYYAVGAP